MNIICVKKCKYKLGEYYSYDLNDYIDGLDIKYYAIYMKEKIVGYSNSRFIEENFSSVCNYLSEMKYVEKIFEFFMDHSIKLESNAKSSIYK